jgi:hypothetical protein
MTVCPALVALCNNGTFSLHVFVFQKFNQLDHCLIASGRCVASLLVEDGQNDGRVGHHNATATHGLHTAAFRRVSQVIHIDLNHTCTTSAPTFLPNTVYESTSSSVKLRSTVNFFFMMRRPCGGFGPPLINYSTGKHQTHGEITKSL